MDWVESVKSSVSNMAQKAKDAVSGTPVAPLVQDPSSSLGLPPAGSGRTTTGGRRKLRSRKATKSRKARKTRKH